MRDFESRFSTVLEKRHKGWCTVLSMRKEHTMAKSGLQVKMIQATMRLGCRIVNWNPEIRSVKLKNSKSNSIKICQTWFSVQSLNFQKLSKTFKNGQKTFKKWFLIITFTDISNLNFRFWKHKIYPIIT